MMRVLQALPLTQSEPHRLTGATELLGLAYTADWVLTTFAMVSLALSLMLLFWVSAEHRRTAQYLSRNLTDSVKTNARLRQENDELTATNEQLCQTIAELRAVSEVASGKVSDTLNAQQVNPSS